MMQTPVIIGIASVGSQDELALDGRVIEPKTCIISLPLGLRAGIGIGLIKTPRAPAIRVIA